MTKVTDWMMDSDGIGAFRMIVGGDPENIAHRVAFIEKTPRVRIREDYLGLQVQWDDAGNRVGETRQWPEFLNWCSGYKGDGCNDPESRAWCDRMLIALGYEL